MYRAIPDRSSRFVRRRDLLRLASAGAGAVLALAASACGAPPAPGDDRPPAAGKPGSKSGPGNKAGRGTKPAAAGSVATPPSTPAGNTVRLSSVVTPRDGGLYDDLLPEFERQSGYRVELTTGEDVYGPARAGGADLVISHYGHHDTEAFVLDGLGNWPRTVFSNQLALLGPPADPAGVRGLADVAEAYRRIASGKHVYVVNNTEGIQYLSEVLWHAAGRPDRAGWVVDDGSRGPPAIALTEQRGGYTLWGLTPFLRTRQATGTSLDPLLLGDPLLQRVLVSVTVKPDRVAGVNAAAAVALQDYLLSPATQARIQAFRLPGVAQQVWWPAARHNKSDHLPEPRPGA